MTLADHPALAARLIGFVETPYDLSDKRPSGLVFLRRIHEGQHQYLSLLSYVDQFCEAVIEVFYAPRSAKARRVGKLSDQQRKGAAPLYTNLARDWEAIAAMVGRSYEVAKD